MSLGEFLDKEELSSKISIFKESWERKEHKDFESTALGIFSGIFQFDGGQVAHPIVLRMSVSGKDALFEMAGVSIGLEVARSIVDTEIINRAIGYVSNSSRINKLLIFSPAGFDSEAISLADNSDPVKVELIDFERLTAWVEGISKKELDDDVLQRAIKDFSLLLAEFVASDPSILNRLEWRDVERMLAIALEKLGFTVELTPPAKDGGRDIVLNCRIFGQSKCYLIEVKHWKTPVGNGVIRDFVRTVIEEQANRGLVLATTGYTQNAFEGLTEFERRRVQGASSETMIAICQSYVRLRAGICIPEFELPKLLFVG